MHLTRKQQLSIIVSGVVLGAVVIFATINSGYLRQTVPISTQVMGYGFSCGGSRIPISVLGAQGFTNVTRPLSDKLPGFFEFVLPANSVGNITMLYDFSQENPSNASPLNFNKGTTQDVLSNTYHQSMADYFGHVEISKVNDKATNKTSESIVYLSSESIKGMRIVPSSMSNVTDSVVKVIYTVKTDADAMQGTYLLGLKICPGELVTIGSEPTQMQLPWSNFTGWY